MPTMAPYDRPAAGSHRPALMLSLVVALFSCYLLTADALTPDERPKPRMAANPPDTVQPPAWLPSSPPRLDRSFWNRAAEMRLPLHRPLKRILKIGDLHACSATKRNPCDSTPDGADFQVCSNPNRTVPSECLKRDEFECISGFRRESTDVSTHYAGDIEMLVFLPLHRNTAPTLSCGVDCQDVDGIAALIKLELIHFLTQMMNSLGVFGAWSFGMEILDSCNHVGHIQKQLLTYGKVSDISPCPQQAVTNVNATDFNGSCPVGKLGDPCLGRCQKRGVRSLVIGPGRSDLCRDTAPFASQYSLSQISYGATLPGLSHASEFPDFFRTVPSDVLLMRALADILTKLEITHVSLLIEDEPFGKKLMREFEKHYKRQCTAMTTFFSHVRTDGLEKAFLLLSDTDVRTAVVVLGEKRASTQIFRTAASLSSRAELLFFASHVDELLLQEWYDLNIVTLSPVPQLHRFSQRAWKEVRSQITDSITSLRFSSTDLTAHRLMKNITDHLHLNAGCGHSGQSGTGSRDTCGSAAGGNPCLVNHLKEEIAAFFDEFEAENELKRLMESIMTGTEVMRSVLNGVAAHCQNYTAEERATLELTIRHLTETLQQEERSSDVYGEDGSEAAARNTRTCLNTTKERKAELERHWCQDFPALLREPQRFTLPGDPVPLSKNLFCNLRHQHLSEEMQKRNLRGESVEQAAYDIIAIGNLSDIIGSGDRPDVTGSGSQPSSPERSEARTWTTVGHWEANIPDPFAVPHGQLYVKNTIRPIVTSYFHASCHPGRCPPGKVEQMIDGVDNCCYSCRLCNNSAVSSADGTECVKCPHCHLADRVVGGSACLPLPVSKSDWDRGWAIAMAVLSVLVCGAIVVAAFWSLHQVEQQHKAKRQSSLRRLTSTSSSVTTTSTDSVSAKPGRSRYVLFALLLAGCLLAMLLPWPPSAGLCTAQQLLLPLLTPLTCASMMLSIVNRHRLTFVAELMRWKREDAATAGHHYMKNGPQYATIAAASVVVGTVVLATAVASESVEDVCRESVRYLQCAVSVAGSATYFVVTWSMWAALFAYALYSFFSAENAGVIFSRPSSIAWALLGLLFLWTLLLPARFVLPEVNPATLVALVNNLHTLVVLAITCLADVRVVRRRQRTSSSSLHNNVSSHGNLTAERQSGGGTGGGGARNGGGGAGGAGSNGNGGAMHATTATAATYLHSHSTTNCNVLVSPLSPSQGADNGKSVTTPDDTVATGGGGGGGNGGGNGNGGKSLLFTFDKPSVGNVVEEVDSTGGGAGNSIDCLKRPVSSLSRNPSVLNPTPPPYEESLAITHISMFNTGPSRAPLSPLPADKTTAL